MEKTQVLLNKIIFKNEKEVELIGDIIVPDSKPDIINIINASGNSYVTKEEVISSKLRIDGMLKLNILYLASTGDLRIIESNMQFLETIDDVNIKSELYSIFSNVYIKEITTKVLNERKLEVHAILKLEVTVFERENIEFLNIDNNSSYESKIENVTVKTFKDKNKTKTSLKENIKLLDTPNNESDNVVEIIKYNIDILNIENKPSFNKILSKADIKINILFITEFGKKIKKEFIYPVTCFMDCEKIVDTDLIDVKYFIRNIDLNIEPKNMLNALIDFDVVGEVSLLKDIKIIDDFYSINSNLKFNKKDVEIDIYKQESKDNNDKVLLHDRLIIDDIMEIYDVDISVKIENVIQKFNDIRLYECKMILKIYYEQIANNNLNIKSVEIPFRFESDSVIKDNDIEIVSKDFKVLDNDNVDYNIEYKLKDTFENRKIVTIFDNIEEEEVEEDKYYKMLLYFIKPGDSLWEIAKKYKVKLNDILSVNDLEDENKISVGDRLYIMK